MFHYSILWHSCASIFWLCLRFQPYSLHQSWKFASLPLWRPHSSEWFHCWSGWCWKWSCLLLLSSDDYYDNYWTHSLLDCTTSNLSSFFNSSKDLIVLLFSRWFNKLFKLTLLDLLLLILARCFCPSLKNLYYQSILLKTNLSFIRSNLLWQIGRAHVWTPVTG